MHSNALHSTVVSFGCHIYEVVMLEFSALHPVTSCWLRCSAEPEEDWYNGWPGTSPAYNPIKSRSCARLAGLRLECFFN